MRRREVDLLDLLDVDGDGMTPMLALSTETGSAGERVETRALVLPTVPSRTAQAAPARPSLIAPALFPARANERPIITLAEIGGVLLGIAILLFGGAIASLIVAWLLFR
jgi:hypothetical protein